MTDPSPFINTEEAATLLRRKPSTIHKMVTKGVLKQGTHWYRRKGEFGILFDREALIAFVREGTGEQSEGIPMARGYVAGTKS
jgi:hypothetical protein